MSKKKNDSAISEDQLVRNSADEKSAKPWYREWTEALVVAFIIAMILRTFVVQAFKIPSGSMEDTLLIGDHLLVNKFLYGTKIPFTDERFLSIREPSRGDIIVFEFPKDEELPFWKRRDFIKRIVGVPGDRIKMVDQVVYVNDEPYVIPQEVHKGAQGLARREIFNFSERVVKPGHYFVMGDNRDRSHDSRFWGQVPEEKIKGLAFIKYWSWDAGDNWPRWDRIGRWIE
ncbi:MAG: signal peptidase I [Desulfuromonadales bacterium]|nr:signal peptidase I [Desulfuromonadales bacterium]NIS42897.1 signal peptidase I [Desulfuromonadales bacterium]